MRPVRGKLTGPIAAIFEEKSRSESVHTLATDILTDYASDEPDRLAELLMVADPKAYRSLFPVALKKAEHVLPVFQAELAKQSAYSWNDPPVNSSWTKPGVSIMSRIDSAQGLLADRFAYCQTMPLDQFLTTGEALQKSGYRPVRFRPYADLGTVKVAAIWTRDGRKWRSASGFSPEQIRQEDEQNRSDGFLPVDVAGYIGIGKDGKPTDHYAALWVENSADQDARLYVGMAADLEDERQDQFKDAQLVPRTRHALTGSDGRTRYCGVWGRSPGVARTSQTARDQFEINFEKNQRDLNDLLLIDVAVSEASKPQTIRDRAVDALEIANKKLRRKPEDLDARFSRAMANFRLGENQKALDDFLVVIGKDRDAVSAKAYRTFALARLAKKEDALSELAKFQKEDAPASSTLYLAAVLSAELGKGTDQAFEALERAIKEQPKDADLLYHAVCAFSLASRAVSHSDSTRGHQLAQRSLQLIRDLVKNGDAEFARMEEDADLDPIRDDPAFDEIMKAGHSDHRYAAVWNADANFEAIAISGHDFAAHEERCRELTAKGYRPVSWSVTRTTREGPVEIASLWHRPVVQEEAKNRLAERQAR